MNILITGPLGHIGSELIRNLYKINKLNKVYLIDSRDNNLNVLFNLKYKKNKIKFLQGDLLNNKILDKVKSKIDVVVHLASITNAEESFKIKNLLYKNNYGIFKNIVNYCIKKKSKLIHISSTSIYGQQSDLVNEECKFLKPQSPYADVKLLEEKFLKRNKNNINFITLRFGTITGVSAGMRFHTAVNKFCFKTILRENIPVWNNAIDQYRPYLSLPDALLAIISIINKNLFDNQTYNVLSRNYTVRQILNIINSFRYSIKIKKTKSPILNQNSYKVSGKKFDKFKIKFKKNIKKDIKNTLNLIKYLY